MMPEDSWAKPSSDSEQSIPMDTWPRIFDFLILNSPGKVDPTVARATRSPCR
jgi:hypothetical protein